MRFSNILSKWFNSTGYTVESFASSIGVETVTVEKWLDGVKRPEPRLINRVSAVTCIDLGKLLDSAGYDKEYASKMGKKPSVCLNKLRKIGGNTYA